MANGHKANLVSSKQTTSLVVSLLTYLHCSVSSLPAATYWVGGPSIQAVTPATSPLSRTTRPSPCRSQVNNPPSPLSVL